MRQRPIIPPTVFLALIAFLLVGKHANAQVLATAFNLESTDVSTVYGITTDALNNIYLAGSYKGTTDFDFGPGQYRLTRPDTSTLYIAKYNEDKALLWVRDFPFVGGWGVGYRCVIDSLGNVYAIGELHTLQTGSIDMDPGPGVHEVATYKHADMFIVKLDGQGNFIWGDVMGSGDYDFILGMDLDAQGNLYIGGSYRGAIDLDPGSGSFVPPYHDILEDMFISKISPEGDLIWCNTSNGETHERLVDLAVVGDRVYSTGYFRDTVDFDPGPGTFFLDSDTTYDKNGFFMVNDLNGNFIHAVEYGGTGEATASDIAMDRDGNIYVSGHFTGACDVDPGPGKDIRISAGGDDMFISTFNGADQYLMTNSFGGVYDDFISEAKTDENGNLYVSGRFNESLDVDPGPDVFTLTSKGGLDGFLMRLDPAGQLDWAFSIGGTETDDCYHVCLTPDMQVLVSGTFERKVDFDPSVNVVELNASFSTDGYLATYLQRGVTGSAFRDIDQNCTKGSSEAGLSGIRYRIEPGQVTGQTSVNGTWLVPYLPVGQYNIMFDTTGHWMPTCTTDTFSVADDETVTTLPPQGFMNTKPCISPAVSLSYSVVRRCFDSAINLQVCNRSTATGIMEGRYVTVTLDTLIQVNSASVPFTSLGNNSYQFDIIDLPPDTCQYIRLDALISCDAALGQTLCSSVSLYPVDSCALEDPQTIISPDNPCELEADVSHLEITGECVHDSLLFTIRNTSITGIGDMFCHAPVSLYIDGHFILNDSVRLPGGSARVFAYSGDGRTWRLDVEQHPNHAGRSFPSATIERCGPLNNWTPGLVTSLPLDELDPVTDIECRMVTGSFDPNDKAGFPSGVGPQHLLSANGQIDYRIRFQNTGNDTAFTVIIRDTIEETLDIFSLQPGASSHSYTFRLYGPRVAEWRFDNILLPDSTTNEQASHGYVTFTIDQRDSLTDGSLVNNSAGIYFDFNDPVITNTVTYTVGDPSGAKSVGETREEYIASCGPALFNGLWYDRSGTYYQILPGLVSDTLVILHFTRSSVDGLADVTEDNGTLVALAPQSLYQWLDCNTNALIPGETNAVFQPAFSGSYAAIVTDPESGCVDTSGCFAITITGIHDGSATSIAIYPNPTDGKLQVLFTQPIQPEIILTDMLGRIILHKKGLTGTTFELDIPGSGFYLLHLYVNGSGSVHKIIRR